MAGWSNGAHQMTPLRVPGARIREIGEADGPALLATCPSMIARHQRVRGRATLESADRFIEWLQAERRTGRRCGLAVVPTWGDRLLGMYHVWSVGDDEQTVGFEAGLGFPFWGSPLFGLWTAAILDYCVDSLLARRVETRVTADNLVGQTALLRLGAVREGVVTAGNGRRYTPQVVWSILSDEWLKRRADRPSVTSRGASMEIFSDDVDLPGLGAGADEGAGLYLVSEDGGPRTARDNPTCCAPPEAPAAVFPDDAY